jgi:hypothetical protein
MPHVGIDISDDAVTFIEYSRPVGDRTIVKFGTVLLPENVIDGGDVKDEKKLIEILSDMAHTHGIKYAKVSIPEEKAYLFETEIPHGDYRTISQNIEFKLEENIPLAAPDAVFAFDILSGDGSKPWRASVSAVPRTYIEHMINILHSAGIVPVSFETTPRAIARIVSTEDKGDTLVVHVMKRKTGVYIVSQHAVGFTSTISAGKDESDIKSYTDILATEIGRVHTYWGTKVENESVFIKRVVIIGNGSEEVISVLRPKVEDILSVEVINVWNDIINTAKYVPPISKTDSYGYASSAGLAI